MRDRDQKLDEIFQRAERLKKADPLRRRIAVDAVCAGFSAAALILLLVTLPGLQKAQPSGEDWRYGALLLNGEYGGYILVAVTALALGVTVTLLCAHVHSLKKLNGKEDRS